jgi:hypothetical protein
VYDHKKSPGNNRDILNIYMSPVTTIFYCVMNSVFLFFFCLNKLSKVNFPNEHVQLSGAFFVVVHDLDLDLHEKINRNKRTRMVIIFFSHLLFFFPAS